ncbi:MAG: glycosyltransferase family 4 protein [Desulfobacterales bacterium]|nr:glycosyltransferase family 4 protein [Desulfobacterales bacterium]MBF0398391.1 glycosyltransferase family 4 protein [Desulfobacterales bacterium]
MKYNRKLKILHFVYDHPDNPWVGGGGALRTWAVNNILSKRHDITVMCGAFPEALNQEKPFKVSFLGKAKNYLESRLKFIWQSRSIDFKPYDIIVEEFSYYAPIFSRFSKKPAVTIIQSNHGFKALNYHPFYGWISIITQYFLLPQRKSVILVSEHLRSAISHKTLISIIPQGADIPDNLPSDSQDYVLYLGRLDVQIKGLDILIKAWSQIPSNLSDTFPLYIAGGGDEDKVFELINLTGAKNVRLIGRLDHNDAMAAIRKAVFLCVPSRMEGSPVVIYEAFALGKPIIGNSIPALKDVVPHGKAGILVPLENSLAFKRAIEMLLTDAKLRLHLSKGAAQLGKEFNWDKIAEKQEEFYFKTANIFYNK